jgi:hypothetical protein
VGQALAAAIGHRHRSAGTGIGVRGDGGSGSVLVLIVIGVLVAAGLGGLVLARGLSERQHLTTATDVLALTAARLPWGGADPCAFVRHEATRRSIEATGCAVIDGVVLVATRTTGPWGIPLTARARAALLSAPT